MMTLEQARIDRERLEAVAFEHPALPRVGGHQVEHRRRQRRLHEPVERAAKRVVVRRLRQADRLPPRRTVRQEGLDPAETFFLVLAQHQTGEQLWVGKIMTAERAVVVRHDPPG